MEADNIDRSRTAVMPAAKIKAALSEQVKDSSLSVMFTDLLRGATKDLHGRMDGFGEGFRNGDEAPEAPPEIPDDMGAQTGHDENEETIVAETPRHDTRPDNEGDRDDDGVRVESRSDDGNQNADAGGNPDDDDAPAEASTSSDDDTASSDANQTKDARDGDTPEAPAEAVVIDTAPIADAAASLGTKKETTGPATAQTILSELVTAQAGASALPQKAADKAEAHSAASKTGTSEKGVFLALSRVSQNTAKTQGPVVDPLADAGKGDPAEKLASLVRGNEGQKTLKAGVHTAKAGSGAQQNANENAVTSDDAKARQAAELARTLSGQGRTKVAVTVTDETKTLISKPSNAKLALTPSLAEASGAQTRTARPGGTAQTQTHAGGADPQLATQAANQAEIALRQAGAAASLQGQANAKAGTGPAVQVSSTSGADGTSTPFSASQSASQTQKPAPAQHAPKAQPQTFQKTVLNQVSVQIAKAAGNANDRISIQLKPAHLGRIDVQMEMASDGRVQATITADNKDTLDLLQKDSRQLEKALQDAGLSTDKDSLSFSLKEQQNQTAEGNGDQDQAAAEEADAKTKTDADDTPATGPAFQEGGIFADGRVDIRA